MNFTAYNMNDESNGEIKVVCRFRPLNAKELQISNSICVDILPGKRSVSVPQGNCSPLVFTLDYIFSPSVSQEEVYEISSKSIIEAVLEGFNGTVLAYGQTSSGKTFTMSGASFYNHETMGIIPRMISHVFDHISCADEHLEFTVKVGYCEIYMERVKDLLDPHRENLKIHEDKIKGIYIGDLTEVYTNCENDVHELMKQGGDNREVGYTDMNAGSSRSHAIFLVTITQTNTKNFSTKVGKLYLVDLAGSEKISKTGATGKRLEEAKTINKSLTVLGIVINNLTDGKSSHIPYRDSKLTRILQDSLGGNSKTALIVTCSPSIYNLDETIGTLRFGVRAKSVKNKPKINKEFTVAELKLMLSKLQDELRGKNLQIEVFEKGFHYNEDDSPAVEILPTKDQANIQELFDEIDFLQTKVDQECENSANLRHNLLEHEMIMQELKLDNQAMVSELKACHEEILDLRNKTSEMTEKAEELSSANEVYESQVKELNLNIIKLEQIVYEREVEIARVKTQFHLGKEVGLASDNESSSSRKLDLILEREKVISLNKQIALLQESFDEIAKKKAPDLLKIRDKLQEEIEIKETTKWLEEKELLNSDLQNRIRKVIELEVALDDSKENYRCLEQKLSQGDRALIKRNDYLEKSIENLTTLYYQLLNERCTLNVQNSALQNKVLKANEKIKLVEEQLIKMKDNLRFSDEKSFAEEIVRLNNSRASRSSQISGNIRKPLKGGSKNT